MPIKFEQFSALKEGTKRLFPCASTSAVPLLQGVNSLAARAGLQQGNTELPRSMEKDGTF